ncbi:non-ribosomal peptide synthetase [Saccharothrix australiensis]|uniref:non-ribosomal peptide synthetase n=1 Tax=Saccharothrix australiensis TaxID=2072 RepID=UPI0014769C00|nr:non-ribosomal peptide synthetase [Saccharothrix australiensis]
MSDQLELRAADRPSARAFTFLPDGETEGGRLTYAELLRRARVVAGELGRRGLAGERALLVYRTGLDFVVSLSGCCYAGVVPVPAPEPAAGSTYRERLAGIAADVRPAVVLTESSVDSAKSFVDGVDAVRTDLLDGAPADAPAPVSPDGVALVQYTSGSTGQPKGVVLSHRNVVENLRLIQAGIGRPFAPDTVVSWLPLFHDMGLFGIVLRALYTGGHAVLMPTGAFLRDPTRWLRAISRYRADVAGGPNFAYELCLRRAERADLDGLDLSCWRTAFNGAEPVRESTVRRFTEVFGAYGLAPEAVWPCYGMAESTLLVAGVQRGERPRFVSLDADRLALGDAVPAGPGGRHTVLPVYELPIPGDAPPGGDPPDGVVPEGVPPGSAPSTAAPRVEVVDPGTGAPLPPGRVGEIWVSGGGVALGYWNAPQESERVFGARLPDGSGPFLRTGDLGCLVDGPPRAVVVTGRLKDVVVVRGRNIYPQDVERAVEAAHEAVRPGGVAAFGVDDGVEEALAVVAEASPGRAGDGRAVAEAVRAAVSSAHGVALGGLAIVRPGGVPRTSSGKVRRGACRSAFLEGRLRVLYQEGPVTPPGLARVADVLAEAGLVGGDRPLSADRRLHALGLDSLKVVALQELVEARLRRRVPLAVLHGCGTVGDLVAALGRLPAEPPVDASSASAARGVAAPTGTALTETVATDRALIDTALIDTALIDTALTDTALIDTALTDTALTDTALTDTAATAPDDGTAFPLTDIQQAYVVGRGLDFAHGGIAAQAYFEYDRTGLDPDRLSAAWHRTVEHHGMLRAVITADGGQRVRPEVERTPIPVDDLRGLPPDRVTAALTATREALSKKARPVDTWPLFDVRLSRMDGDRWRVHVGVDLLIADGRSLLVIVDTWGRYYADPDAELPRPAVGFRDHVEAQRRRRTPRAVEAALAHWRERADRLPPGPRLPEPHVRPPTAAPDFHRFEAEVDRGTWARLRGRAEQAGLTPSAVLAACYAATLRRWSARPDFSLNITFFNRPPTPAGLADVVGEFTSIVPVGVDPAREDLLSSARDIQEQLWSALEHRAVSGIRALQEVSAARGLDEPLVLPFVFTSVLEDVDEAGAWLGTRAHTASQTPQVVLDHQVFTRSGNLLLTWDADRTRFPPGLVEEVVATYTGALRALADPACDWAAPVPVRPPSATPPVTAPAERWTGSLLTRVLAAARRDPSATAVVAGGVRLGYAELLGRAAAVAADLRRAGARPEAPVAVVADKGWQQVVGVLGVLGAGAPYLPVDPDLPPARLAQVFDDSGATLAVTTEGLASSVPWPPGVRTVVVRRDHAAGEHVLPAGEEFHEADDSELAYVIYTSGTTGRPKGVMIEHGAALATVGDVVRRLGIGARDAVLGVTPPTFDLSVFDLFGVLGVGGTLVLPDADRAVDPRHWADLLRAERVTVWNSAPALMRLLLGEVRADTAAALAPLRVIMLSADWIPVGMAARLRRECPDARLVSLGGATEAAIWSVCYPVDRVDPAWPSVPYGTALAGQGCAILDDALRPCPVWVPGELHITGAGLARGYWRDPERTAAAFPVHPGTGERMYRTGDIARWLPDGNVELLGRVDFQIKVHGVRVEPAEIETALADHPGVAAAVVVGAGERDGERRLVAFVVGPADLRPELGRFLSARLPAALVPRDLRFVGELPVTANGKVDRAALQRLADAPPDASATASTGTATGTGTVTGTAADGTAEHAAPGGGVAARVLPELTALAADVLGRAIEPGTDLHELGVGSMDLIRLVNAVERRFGVRPPVRDVLRAPTLAGLAGLLGSAPAGPRRAEVFADAAERSDHVRRRVAWREFDGGRLRLHLPGHPSSADDGRRTTRDFAPEPVPLDRWSAWLGALRAQRQAESAVKLRYPSAGGAYPVQTYLHVKPGRVEGLAAGLYYYDPRGHALVMLRADHALPSDIHWPTNRGVFERAAFSVFLVASMAAIEPLYGDLARDFCLVEAGAMTQLLMAEGNRLGVGLCPIGAVTPTPVLRDLGLSGPHELVASMVGGAPAPEGADGVAESAAAPRLAETPAPRHAEAPTPHHAEVPAAHHVEVSAGGGHHEAPRRSPTPTALRDARSVVVTGATGFLGGRVVAELLRCGVEHVHCVVRAPDRDEAVAKLARALEPTGVAVDERVVPVPGDLRLPRFGLDDAAWAALAERADVVVHNGAVVNWLADYRGLAPVNVGATGQALELAGPDRPLVHVSTVGVFPFGGGAARVVREDDPPGDERQLFGGYTRTKRAAEQLVVAARRRGSPVTVARPGTITGHSRTGRFNQASFLDRMLVGCIHLGCAPDLDMWVDMSPVDAVASSLVHLPLGGTYHLTNPRPAPLARVLAWLGECGYPLRTLPFDRWRAFALDSPGFADNALHPFEGFLAAAAEEHLAMPRFDCAATSTALAGAGVRWPPVDGELVARYLDTYARAGLIPTPARGR